MSSLTITLIQTNLHWQNRAANLSMFSGKIASVNTKTQIIILPEMFSTGFTMQPEIFAESMDGETINWMKKTASEKRVILTGSIAAKENDNYYNRLIWMLPNGSFGYYDKRHLFAYAGEDMHYAPGSKRLITCVNSWKINMQVCYDLRFPVWARQQIGGADNNQTPEYDMLVYVANWPERRNHAWKTLLQARAIENQCYVVGVNRVGNDGSNIYHSGDSMVVSPVGEVLYQRAHEEDIFTITLQKDELNETRTRFPFWKDADKFTIHNK
jgi:predicted amidohydrolase